ncbi:MAG: UbiA prenyltransferase family protein [bacterium]
MPKLAIILRQMRVTHWVKNLVVFLPLFFGSLLFDKNAVWHAMLAFLAISFAASTIYIINDLADLAVDQQHPTKKLRPLAAGEITNSEARLLAMSLTALSLIVLLIIGNINVTLIIFCYLVLNITYSNYLKHIAIVEIFVLAGNYLIRLYLGGLATGIMISIWIFVTILFGSFILISGKRLAEMKRQSQRKVLKFYTTEFLNGVVLISLAVSVTAFALYTVALGFRHLPQLLIFCFILFRYYYLITLNKLTEQPEKVFLTDKMIMGGTLSFFIATFLILYL